MIAMRGGEVPVGDTCLVPGGQNAACPRLPPVFCRTGIRWWDNDVDVTVDPAVLPGAVQTSLDEDWVDPVIGGRYFYPLGNRWTPTVQGDIGGFGIGSDFSFGVAVGAFYRISDAMRLGLRDKALRVDYEDGIRGQPGYLSYDTVTHGPIIGLDFDF
jgi:hypothetical protein